MTTPLNRELRKALVRLAERNPDFRRPARIVLGIDAGRTIEHIANSVRVSVDEVVEWHNRYDEEGLAIFAGVLPDDLIGATSEIPDEPLTDDETSEEPIEAVDEPPDEVIAEAELAHDVELEAPPEVQAEPAPINVPQAAPPQLEAAPPAGEVVSAPVDTDGDATATAKPTVAALPDYAPDTESAHSISALAAAFDVDLQRARHRSQLARELFALTSTAHRLPAHLGDLLHAAALLHRIADTEHPTHYATASRDYLVNYQLKELSGDERQMLAAIIALQDPQQVPQQDPSYKSLEDEWQAPTEILLGLFRIALGLDSQDTQDSVILEWHDVPGELQVIVGGANAPTHIQTAHAASTLWNNRYELPRFRFLADSGEEQHEELAVIAHLSKHDLAVDVSNKLRTHYATRFEYLVERIRRKHTGLLVPLWQEFQRLTGIWQWVLPGSKPRQVFSEDTDWLATLIRNALQFATLVDRVEGLLLETDPGRDDPAAIRGLKTLQIAHIQYADAAFEALREASRGRRYERWLNGVMTPLKHTDDPTTFSSQVGVRAWAYLTELRHVIDHVNAAGMNADLSELLTLEVIETFESDLRLLTDTLVYSASLLSTEVQQVLQVLEPLDSYVQAWQRMENAAQYATQLQQQPGELDVDDFVLHAFAVIMRERADEMRWNLADMWETLETTSFRRALALAVAKP